jgi:hypothetical protein
MLNGFTLFVGGKAGCLGGNRNPEFRQLQQLARRILRLANDGLLGKFHDALDKVILELAIRVVSHRHDVRWVKLRLIQIVVIMVLRLPLLLLSGRLGRLVVRIGL